MQLNDCIKQIKTRAQCLSHNMDQGSLICFKNLQFDNYWGLLPCDNNNKIVNWVILTHL